MKKKRFIRLLHNRIAELAVGSSALRNQGAENVVSNSRKYLKSLRISSFVSSRNNKFQNKLDSSTKSLLKRLPPNAQNWGTARKALNLFLRDVLYNSYLCEYYRFEKVEKHLEIPLDSYTMDGIRKGEKKNKFLKRINIKDLTPEISKCYQCAAQRIADKKKITRIQLDLIYWRSKNNKST